MYQRGTADLAQFLPPPSNSGPQELERIAGSVRGASAFAVPHAGLFCDHPNTPPPWPTSVYTCCSCLTSRRLAGLRSKGQVLCSCFKAITLKPHSQLSNGLWLFQPSARTPNWKKHWDKEENQKPRGGKAGWCHSNQPLSWDKRRGAYPSCPIPVSALLYWMGILGGLHTLCLTVFG